MLQAGCIKRMRVGINPFEYVRNLVRLFQKGHFHLTFNLP